MVADLSFGQGGRVDVFGITRAQFAARTISNVGSNAPVVFGGGVGEICFDGVSAAQGLDSWAV
ncbi:MAG: hypothetical protein COY86_07155 [Rhodobacterales bacterium CG_4_10_14_0_8_um_filter_70_9]|nr:MAG: hypothetical protein COY86_07155 [Rhodobacterales bacterium CG_4_10_14_0_8_um_filter_70_9]